MSDRDKDMKENKDKKTHPDGRLSGLSALSAAFVQNSGPLKHFLTRFLSQQQDIEDVVQETWLRAYKAEQTTKIDQPRAFLFRVARNIAINELRRKSREMHDYIEDCDDRVVLKNTDTLESEIEARQNLGLYCEAIAALPERCRRVYLLRKVHGLRHKEIAERLGITVSAVEKHMTNGAVACEAFLQAREQARGDDNGNRGDNVSESNGQGTVHDLPVSKNRDAVIRKGPE